MNFITQNITENDFYSWLLIVCLTLFMLNLFLGFYTNPAAALGLTLLQGFLAVVVFMPQIFGWYIVPIVILYAYILK